MARAILPAQYHSLLIVLHKNGVLSALHEKTFVDQAFAPGWLDLDINISLVVVVACEWTSTASRQKKKNRHAVFSSLWL